MSAPLRRPVDQVAGEGVAGQAGPVLAGHRPDHERDLVFRSGREQREMDLGPALALQVDRQQVGAAGQEHPDQLAAVTRVAHLRGDHREDPARGARVAAGLALAERGVGLVDDDHDRAHRPQDREDLLEVGLGLADVLRPEVPQLHARDAHRPGEALGQVGLARADRPADQVAHRCGVEPTLEQRAASSSRRCLTASLPTKSSSRCGGSTNSTSPRAWRSISPFLSVLSPWASSFLPERAAADEQPVQVDEVQAARQLGQLRRGEVGEVAGLAVARVEGRGESLARRGVGHRDRQGGDVRAGDQPLVDLREVVAEQAEGDIVPLDVGVLRPGEQADQPACPGARPSARAPRTGTRNWA